METALFGGGFFIVRSPSARVFAYNTGRGGYIKNVYLY